MKFVLLSGLLLLSATSVFAFGGKKGDAKPNDPYACDASKGLVASASGQPTPYTINGKSFYTFNWPSFCLDGHWHYLLNDDETAANFCKLVFYHIESSKIAVSIGNTKTAEDAQIVQISDLGPVSLGVDPAKTAVSLMTCVVPIEYRVITAPGGIGG